MTQWSPLPVSDMKVLRLFLLLLLPACTNVKPPQLQAEDGLRNLPAQWRNSAPGTELEAAQARDGDWWLSFGSNALAGMVQQAQLDSYDIAAAIARVEQAQHLAVVAGAPLLPEVSATGNIGRQQRLGGSSDANRLSTYSVGLLASYEIDFWGKNRAAYQGALSNLRATEFDRDSMRVTLGANVAMTWVEAVGLAERVGIARSNLENAERVLALVESRYRAGAATAIEQAQQQGLVATQRRTVALLRQQQGNAEAALATLASRPVGELQLMENSVRQLQLPIADSGVPSELLVRRPDIALAEARLLAADADIQVARAAMLPSIRLTGGFSSNSEHLRDFFDAPLYNLAAGLTAPIFNAGRLAAQRDFAVARRKELLANYRQAIIAALGDVEAALNRIAGLEQQAIAQTLALENAERAFALAQSRYQAGTETMLTMLDTQRTLFTAQDLDLQLRQQRLQAAVDLYRALGGGWQRP